MKQIIKRAFRFPAIYAIEEGKIILAKPEKPDDRHLAIDVRRREPGESVSFGQQVPGTQYLLVRATQKYFFNEHDVRTDDSEIVLLHKGTKKEFVWKLNRVGDSPESFVLFRDEETGSEFPVKLDARFQFPPKTGPTFRITGINEAGVQVEDVKTGKTFKIDRLVAAP